jgi:hypothetical protein
MQLHFISALFCSGITHSRAKSGRGLSWEQLNADGNLINRITATVVSADHISGVWIAKQDPRVRQAAWVRKESSTHKSFKAALQGDSCPMR